MNKLLFTTGILLMTALSVQATEAPSLELGRTLFESLKLGNKELSCATCHPDGKGLEMVGDFNDTELKGLLNNCLQEALGAEPISTDAQEMNALVGYVRSFQKKQ